MHKIPQIRIYVANTAHSSLHDSSTINFLLENVDSEAVICILRVTIKICVGCRECAFREHAHSNSETVLFFTLKEEKK